MPASAVASAHPFRGLPLSSPSTRHHVSAIPLFALHNLNALHLSSQSRRLSPRFTYSIPIGPRSGLLETAVSAMLRPTLPSTQGFLWSEHLSLIHISEPTRP